MPKTTKAQADSLAQTFDQLDAQIKTLTTERDQAKSKLLAYAAERGGKAETSNYTVVRIESHRIDAAKLEKVFPAAKHPEFYKLAVDTATVKDAIAAKDLLKFQVSSFRLSVTRNDV